jgi:hypothetical protein
MIIEMLNKRMTTEASSNNFHSRLICHTKRLNIYSGAVEHPSKQEDLFDQGSSSLFPSTTRKRCTCHGVHHWRVVDS